MVNFGLNSASILGIFLAVAGAGLYFMRTIRPELSRDHDIFFAAVGLLCGFILLFQGWRLDPILQFGQFLLTGAAVFFAFETIKLRGVATEQARRNSPIVDDERRVSKVYKAELDQLEPYDYETDERYEDNPRLRGYEEQRTSRSARYDNDEPRSSRTRPAAERPSSRENPKRRSRPSSPPPTTSYDEWNEAPSGWEESSNRPPRRRPPSDVASEQPTRQSSRKRSSRPSDKVSPYQDEAPAPYVDYVDYQPIDEDKESWEREQPTKPTTPERDEPRDDNNPVRFDY